MLRDFLKRQAGSREIVDDRQMSPGISEPSDSSTRSHTRSAALSPVPLNSMSGAALVLVLACLALLTVVVISLMVGATQELNTAKSYSEQVEARRLAASTLELVKGQIWAATTEATNSSWASQPGAIRTFTSGNTNLVNVYKLYSSDTMVVPNSSYTPASEVPANWASLPNEFVDLNRPVVVGIVTNYPIFNPSATNSVAGFAVTNAPGATTTTNPLPMPVRWIYVRRDGSLANSSGATNYDASNPIVGRIAFWTDDDTCKININTASAIREGEKNGTANTQSFWDLPYGKVEAEYDLAQCQPAQREYQRYPGHPARVNLKTVFTNMTASQIYDMTPRTSSEDTNGSFGGTRGPTNALERKSERLYATLDEFFYKIDRTPNNANVTSTNLNRLEGFLTAYNRAPEINLFGRPRISMWPVNADPSKRTPLDKWFAICSTMVYGTGASVTGTNLFAVTRSVSTNATGDLTVSGATIPKLFTYLQNQTKDAPPGYNSSFLTKYTAAGRDQLLTLSLDYIRCVNLYDASANNANWSDVSPSFTGRYNSNSFTVPQYGGTNLDGGALGVRAPAATGLPYITSMPGFGQAVPLRISSSSGSFNGLGRFDTTISEAAFHFWALSWNGPGRIYSNQGFWVINMSYYYFNATNNSATNIPVLGFDFLTEQQEKALNVVRENDVIVTNANSAGIPMMQVVGIDYASPDKFLALATNNIKPLITRNSNGTITNYPTNSTIISVNSTFFTTTYVDVNGTTQTNYNYPPFRQVSNTNTNNWTPHFPYVIPGTGAPMYAAQLLIAPFNPMNGYSRYGSDYLHRVRGLSSFRVNGTNIFPASVTVNGTNNVTDPALNWVRVASQQSQIGGSGFYSTLLNSSNGVGKFASFNNGTSITGLTSANQKNYPFVSRIFPVPDGVPMRFSGGDLALEILSRAGDLIQTLNLNFPETPIARPYPVDHSVFSGPIDNDDNYTQFSAGRRMRSLGYSPWEDNSSQICWVGDTIISVEANGPATDYRWLSLQTNVPSTLFQPHPRYYTTTTNENMASGLRKNYTQGRISGATWNGGDAPTNKLATSGTLLTNGAPAGRSLPIISSRYTGITNAQGRPPDFETGLADVPDGAYSRKPDEPTLKFNFDAAVMAVATDPKGALTPYYVGLGNNGWGWVGENTLFAPNRQVPSPGMMGGLPSRGTEANGAWETLLFCPNPAAGATASAHRGFDSPPDHLWMDLFTMPIVEPYAISEPFSTAGKINMNYQIVPFTYVTRSTGLRAVLAANRVSAMTNASPNAFPLRYPIHLDETLNQFQSKFTNNQIFKSASEISSMWLYPGNLTNSTNRLLTAETAGSSAVISTWWYSGDRPLTGDNLREQPYTALYQNLTTQANTYTVHVYVQALDQPPSGKLIVTGEYRGSYALERFLDPKDPSLPDFTDPTKPNAMGYYQFRVNNTTQFLP